MEPIHLVTHASQPFVEIKCKDKMYYVAFQPKDLPNGVYLADPNHKYTFDKSLVTCKDCLKKR